jgi:hypothetical protein
MEEKEVKIIDIDAEYSGHLSFADPEFRQQLEENEGIEAVNEAYPILKLSREKKNKGCYLFYEWEYPDIIIPLYVGRTCTFMTRFAQHWNGAGGWMSRYYDRLEDGTWKSERPYDILFSVWLIEDAKERIFREHRMIDLFRPEFNLD